MDLSDTIDHNKTQTICLVVIAAVLATFSIYWLRPVLLPLVVALFVVSGVTPILEGLERRLGVSRIIASGISFVAGLLLMVGFGATIFGSVSDLKSNSDDYVRRVESIVDYFESKASSLSRSITQSKQDQTEETPSTLNEQSVDASSETSGTEEADHADPSEFVEAFLRDGISMLSQVFLGLVSNCVVVLIYVFFLLLGTSKLGAGSKMAGEIDQQIRSYLSLKTIISIFTGAAFGLALFLFGVPMALTFGVLAFLLNFIPNIGPLVASLLPVPLILLDPSGNILWMIAVISVTSMIQVVSGNLVEPKLMGNSANLHPVTVLVALMFWGMMWGIVGMFLATPLTAVIRILLQRVEWLRPLADLMSGQFPNETAEAPLQPSAPVN